MEALERKKENQRLLDEESSKIKGKSSKEAGHGGKVTRAQIEEALQNEQQLESPKGRVEFRKTLLKSQLCQIH